jgi:hypothetical protein
MMTTHATLDPRPTVVIAHELVTYSSLLADALARLRPCFDVHHVPALDLDATITEKHAGAVVVTSELTHAVETHAAGWLLYYPRQENVAVVSGAPAPRRIEIPPSPT